MCKACYKLNCYIFPRIQTSAHPILANGMLFEIQHPEYTVIPQILAKDCFSKSHIQRLTACCHSKQYHKTMRLNKTTGNKLKAHEGVSLMLWAVRTVNMLDDAPNSKHICRTESLQLCIPTSHCAEGYEYKTKQVKKRGNVLYKHSKEAKVLYSLNLRAKKKNTCPNPNISAVLLLTPYRAKDTAMQAIPTSTFMSTMPTVTCPLLTQYMWLRT